MLHNRPFFFSKNIFLIVIDLYMFLINSNPLSELRYVDPSAN